MGPPENDGGVDVCCQILRVGQFENGEPIYEVRTVVNATTVVMRWRRGRPRGILIFIPPRLTVASSDIAIHELLAPLQASSAPD